MARSTVAFVVVVLVVSVNSLGDILTPNPDQGDETSSSLEEQGEFANFNKRDFTRRRRSLDYNLIVDGLLSQLREHVVEEGIDELPIPDIHESFKKQVLFVTVTGSFEARNGRVRSVASIRRTGDVSFSVVPNQSVTLTAHIGFGEVFVRYDDYKAKLMDVGPGGRISASVGENSGRLRLRLDVAETTCDVTLEEITVLKLEGIHVDVTGLWPLDSLASDIITLVVTIIREDVKKLLGRVLHSEMERVIKNFNCQEHVLELRDFAS